MVPDCLCLASIAAIREELCPDTEKETLLIVVGAERFYQYLYGRHFTVINDHQPLKSIFNKSITQCLPRIRRFFIKLQKYDFDLEYAPGKTMSSIVGGFRPFCLRRNEAEWLIFIHFETDRIIIHVFLWQIN